MRDVRVAVKLERFAVNRGLRGCGDGCLAFVDCYRATAFGCGLSFLFETEEHGVSAGVCKARVFARVCHAVRRIRHAHVGCDFNRKAVRRLVVGDVDGCRRVVDKVKRNRHFHVVFDVVECRHVFAVRVCDGHPVCDKVESLLVCDIFAHRKINGGESSAFHVAVKQFRRRCKSKVRNRVLTVLICDGFCIGQADRSLSDGQSAVRHVHIVVVVGKGRGYSIARARVASKIIAGVLRGGSNAVERAGRHGASECGGDVAVRHALVVRFDGYGAFCHRQSAFRDGNDVVVACVYRCDDIFLRACAVALRISAGVAHFNRIVAEKRAVRYLIRERRKVDCIAVCNALVVRFDAQRAT